MKPTTSKIRSEKEILTDIIAAIDANDDTLLLTLIDEYERTYGELPNMEGTAGIEEDLTPKSSVLVDLEG
jgi:peptide subunit release factor 1 (eRF1)